MLIGFPVTVKIQVALREAQSRPLSVFVSLLIVARQNIFTIKVNQVGFFGDKKQLCYYYFYYSMVCLHQLARKDMKTRTKFVMNVISKNRL